MGNVIIRPIIAGGKIITNQPKNEKYWEVAGYKKNTTTTTVFLPKTVPK